MHNGDVYVWLRAQLLSVITAVHDGPVQTPSHLEVSDPMVCERYASAPLLRVHPQKWNSPSKVYVWLRAQLLCLQ